MKPNIAVMSEKINRIYEIVEKIDDKIDQHETRLSKAEICIVNNDKNINTLKTDAMWIFGIVTGIATLAWNLIVNFFKFQ